MQSQTPITDAQIRDAFVLCGTWAAQDSRPEVMPAYNNFYGMYLAAFGVQTPARPTAQRNAPPARPARQAQSQRSANPARQRTRATSGTPGPKDAQVLAKIVATPGIAIEPLRRYFENPARKMNSNILGTAISRLMKAGHITGTPKVGPFTATATGLDAAKKVTSINTRRRASSRSTTGVEPTSEQAQAAATG